jgi:hypothetical protein
MDEENNLIENNPLLQELNTRVNIAVMDALTR